MYHCKTVVKKVLLWTYTKKRRSQQERLFQAFRTTIIDAIFYFLMCIEHIKDDGRFRKQRQ